MRVFDYRRTKGVIRSRESKDRQYSGKNRTNNDIQITTNQRLKTEPQ